MIGRGRFTLLNLVFMAMQVALFGCIVYFWWPVAEETGRPGMLLFFAFCIVAFITGVIFHTVMWLRSLFRPRVQKFLGEKQPQLRRADVGRGQIGDLRPHRWIDQRPR